MSTGHLMFAVLACGACCALPAFAEPSASLPPEVERTTSAFVGNWTAEATVKVGDAAPETFPLTLKCRAIADSRGAACDMSGTSSMGPFAATCMMAFDPVGTTGVHFMCVTTDGEVHDHRGRWTDATHVAFDRLSWSGGPGGNGYEDLACSWPTAKTMVWTSVTQASDGTKVKFDVNAKR